MFEISLELGAWMLVVAPLSGADGLRRAAPTKTRDRGYGEA